MTAPKKRITRRMSPKNLRGCPRCGQSLVIRAGLTVCAGGCGYCADVTGGPWAADHHKPAGPKAQRERDTTSHPYLEPGRLDRELKL